MSARRVMVTGIGLVTPLGTGLEATRRMLAAGHSVAAPPTTFDASGFACRDAAEVSGFNPRDHFRVPKALKLTDRITRFAVAAATMALADARWNGDAEDLGVVIGSSSSDLQLPELAHAIGADPDGRAAEDTAFFAERMLAGLHPLWLLVNLPNMASAHVAIQVQARGPNSTVMTDWVAGSQAIGEAFEWIRSGEADGVLAGGADSGLQPFAYAACEQAGLFAEARPPGRRFVPGEGSAVLLLEERAHAIARGAPLRAEMCAYAAAGDNAGMAGAQTLARTMARALDAARWRAQDVGVLGLASICVPRYEQAEHDAVSATFGHPEAVPTAAFTPILGHAFGAAGAIDAALLLDAERGSSRRLLCSALGRSGQAVTLGFESAATVASRP